MKTDRVTEPLLSIGTFGIHLLLNNSTGKYNFFGTIPCELKNAHYETFEVGLTSFVIWFKKLPVGDQRGYIGNTRADVFRAIMES